MNIVIGWPEGIYLALLLLGFGYAIAKHGEPRDNYDAVMYLVRVIVIVSLLWWGGFFS